ncbi:Uncharacterised protein [Escherichia coli]|nr:Uncharacterised protein [Escherichia coli]
MLFFHFAAVFLYHLFLMCCCFVFDAIHKFNGKYTKLFDALFVELYTLNVHDM